MSRPRLQIVAHLSHTEIMQQYEACCDDKVKVYWLTVCLLSQSDPPLGVEQVAEIVQFSTDWVRKLAHRYNRFGPAGLTGHFQRRRKPRSHASNAPPSKSGNLLRQADASSVPIDPTEL
jgi:hypothetical protein